MYHEVPAHEHFHRRTKMPTNSLTIESSLQVVDTYIAGRLFVRSTAAGFARQVHRYLSPICLKHLTLIVFASR